MADAQLTIYKPHALCDLFPAMSGKEFDALVIDIAANGLREPIVVQGEAILDGANRYRACVAAGVQPRYREFEGADLVAFVLSANLHRRHMTPGQQAAAVAAAQDWAKAQPAGGDRRSNESATLHFDSTATRASTSGASVRTQKMADKVAKADPALAKKVAKGEVSLQKAEALVSAKGSKKQRNGSKRDQGEPGKKAMESYDDLYDDATKELELAHNQIVQMTEELQAAEADDQKAETLKWRRAYDHATKAQSTAMDNAARLQKELQSMSNRLVRIGKLFGERDPVKIPALVETFYREHGPTRGMA